MADDEENTAPPVVNTRRGRLGPALRTPKPEDGEADGECASAASSVAARMAFFEQKGEKSPKSSGRAIRTRGSSAAARFNPTERPAEGPGSARSTRSIPSYMQSTSSSAVRKEVMPVGSRRSNPDTANAGEDAAAAAAVAEGEAAEAEAAAAPAQPSLADTLAQTPAQPATRSTRGRGAAASNESSGPSSRWKAPRSMRTSLVDLPTAVTEAMVGAPVLSESSPK